MIRDNYKDKIQRIKSFYKSISKRVKRIFSEQGFSMRMINKRYKKIILIYWKQKDNRLKNYKQKKNSRNKKSAYWKIKFRSITLILKMLR
jgi:hypothetical protein